MQPGTGSGRWPAASCRAPVHGQTGVGAGGCGAVRFRALRRGGGRGRAVVHDDDHAQAQGAGRWLGMDGGVRVADDLPDLGRHQFLVWPVVHRVPEGVSGEQVEDRVDRQPVHGRATDPGPSGQRAGRQVRLPQDDHTGWRYIRAGLHHLVVR